MLAEVLKALPGLIYVFNQMTMSNEYANRSIGEDLGYSAEEIRGFGAEMMPNLCHPEDLPRVMDHFGVIGSLNDGEVAEVEYRFRHKDGRWIWILSRDAVFGRDEKGQVVRHIGLASDLTAQKNAERMAQKEARHASAANDDLRAFAYAVSHEMKSPSNTLGMLIAEVLELHGNDMPEDAKYLIRLAQDSVKRMQSRIEDLLDLTHFLASSDTRGDVDLEDVLTSTVIELASKIEECQAQVTVGPMPVITASGAEMQTLFHNLIDNALKFRALDQAPRIQVWDESDPEDEYATIVVRDNGIGIQDAERDHIFEMFKRLHLQNNYPGIGLGLAISRRIVEGHDGEILARSAPDVGTDFRVRLKK